MLDEKLRDYVEVFLVVLEHVLNKCKNGIDVFQLKLVFLNQPQDPQNFGLEDDLILTLKGLID